MMKKFIILTTGRTGSTYLRLWLNNHPEIRCHGEVLNRGYGAQDGFYSFANQNYLIKAMRKFFGDHQNKFRSNAVSHKLLELYMHQLFYDEKKSGPWNSKNNWLDFYKKDMNKTTVGFKLTYPQLYYYQDFLVPWITKEKLRIIHLVRNNLLDIYLSFIRANQTGLYHSEEDLNTIDNKLLVDPEEALFQMNKMIEERQKVLKYFSANPIMEIAYEDIFSDDIENSKIQNLFLFLDVKTDNIPERPKLKKVGKKRKEDEIKNFNELSTHLRGTSFETYIYP